MKGNKMDKELKIAACPWCGGSCSTSQGIEEHAVECDNALCVAMGPDADTVEEAIEKWNRVAGEHPVVCELEIVHAGDTASMNKQLAIKTKAGWRPRGALSVSRQGYLRQMMVRP